MLLFLRLASCDVVGWCSGLAYRDLEHELLAIVGGLKGVENGGELLGIELDCRLASAYLSCDDVESIEILTIDNGTCVVAERAVSRAKHNFPGTPGRQRSVPACPAYR